MSMDLAVWSESKFDLPKQLPRSDDWTFVGTEWYFETSGWLISILCVSYQPNVDSDTDDVPNSRILEKLPQAREVAYVTLEPIGAELSGYQFLEEVVRTLAKTNNGVWVDPYEDPFFHDEGSFY